MSLYLDHNATEPLDPEVRAVMEATAQERWGSSQSVHAWGQRARAALEEAREQAAVLVGAQPRQVTFTSGATEANNTVLKGRALHPGSQGTLLVGATEHASIRGPARYLGERGFPVAEIPVDGQGRVTPTALRDAIEAHWPVSLVSVLWAHNETGAVQPIPELAGVCAELGVPLHSDAVQAVGKVAVDFGAGPAAISLSAHKLGGPKGVGALVCDPEALTLDPLLHGGGQERGWRAGTENLPGIAGFGRAAELAAQRRPAWAQWTADLRDRLEARLSQDPVGAEVLSGGCERLPNTSCLVVPGVRAETLLMALDLEGIAVSSGSACASGSLEPSPALQAMGLSPERSGASVRVSLAGSNTAEEMADFADRLEALVSRLRQRSSAAG